jgi:hypothetical protein
VTVLSAADPVRVFQEFATLDLISRGRAEIVAGKVFRGDLYFLYDNQHLKLDFLEFAGSNQFKALDLTSALIVGETCRI